VRSAARLSRSSWSWCFAQATPPKSCAQGSGALAIDAHTCSQTSFGSTMRYSLASELVSTLVNNAVIFGGTETPAVLASVVAGPRMPYNVLDCIAQGGE
jgi:hypothetical protein